MFRSIRAVHFAAALDTRNGCFSKSPPVQLRLKSAQHFGCVPERVERVRHAGEMCLTMTYCIAIVAGLIGAIAGWFGGDVVAPYAPDWLAVPDIRIGQIGGAFGVREIGSLVGLIAGTLLALRLYGGYRRKPVLVAHTVLATLVSGGLIYAAVAGGTALVDVLGVNPLTPKMDFEIRLPSGTVLPTPRDEIQIELRTDRNEVLATIVAITESGDRPVLAGQVPLVFRTSQRSLVMSLPGQPVQIFRLRLAANPSAAPELGPWQQVDFLAEAGRQPRRADVTADYAIRYRVR
jgi:hypothetical protein